MKTERERGMFDKQKHTPKVISMIDAKKERHTNCRKTERLKYD